jgi:hypothetical protein
LSSLKFSVHEVVSAFDPNFKPLVNEDAVGSITKVYPKDATRKNNGYDVLLETTEGTVEDFYFHEFELSEVK